jgi:hypothetical protein
VIHNVVSASYPGSGPIGAHVADVASTGDTLDGGAGVGAASLKDLSWRWLHHDAQLVDPDGHTAADIYGTRFNPIAWTRGIGGGDGPLNPYLSLSYGGGSNDVVIDPNNASTKIWTLIVAWRSIGPITNSGDAPATFSSSPVRPSVPTLAPQPIIGNSYNNGPWILYRSFLGSWVGGPGDWTLVITSKLNISYGGGGGTTYTVSADGIEGGLTLLEFDNVARVIRMYGGAPGAWALLATTPVLPVGAPGGLPQNHILGGGTLGPYYWTWYLHLFGYIQSLAIIGDTAAYTTALLDSHSIEPGTGPPVPVMEWRTVEAPTSPPVSGRLEDYAHYWPLADASPGPMIDIVAGGRLTVVAPSIATFQVDGEPGTVAPHDKGIRLGPPVSSSTVTYLTWGGSGSRPTIGAGGLGHDFSITMRMKWEGPIRNGSPERVICRSGQVPFGFAAETAVDAYIGRMLAEPFGVGFRTWDSTHNRFDELTTTDFDWPAGFEVIDGVPTKIPTWAHFAIVYRTVGAAIEKEIWIDGVLLASGAADAGGWGVSVALQDVGLSAGNGITGALQDLALWPFALTAAELATLAG